MTALVVRGPSRAQVRRVACPRCRVGPGEPCRRVNGAPRKSNHVQRVDKYAGRRM